MLVVFDDTIAYMVSNKKLDPVVTEVFIRGRKLNMSLVFTTRSYFPFPKDIRLTHTHYFIMKILNKWELQNLSHNSSDTDFKDFMNLCRKNHTKP